ncbi:MAG TPA: DNA primase [Chthoniobacteraceae bacterium]|nr:DNA primase [Chthoniobacteraceae bacterium]
MIPEEVLQRVAAANDVVDVISSYFPLKRAGVVYKALCPFHREKTPSFTVNPARQTFKCFGCGAGGPVFRFVELYENVNFPEAVKRLAARAGIRIVDEPLSPEEDAQQRLRRRLLALHAEAAQWFHRNLLRTRAAQGARDYLKKRGITGEVAKTWQLGYAPESWDALSGHLRAEGFSERELIASGVVTVKEDRPGHFYDRFRDRLMFPICNDLGNVIAFSGRILNPEAEQYGGKYVNSPETALFTKGKVLFGLHKSKRAIIGAESAIVCEGQLDLITAFEAGICNVIAPQGTAFTGQQAGILKRFAQEVVLCFDADAAGFKAAERSLPALLGVGLSVRVAAMPPGHDPDSLIRAEGPERFRAVIDGARDFFEFQLETFAATPEFATPTGKTAFARKIAENVALIGDAILREAVVNNLSSRLEIAPQRFLALLKPNRRSASRYREEPEEEPIAPGPEEGRRRGPLGNTVRLLSQLLLVSPEVKTWLAAQDPALFLNEVPEGDFPLLLLAGTYEPGDAASLAAFLTTLSDADQGLAAELLDLRPQPSAPLAVAHDCWRDLLRTSLVNRRDAITARLRQPGLAEGEIVALQKQVLDLTRELTHITRPLSSFSQNS